MNPKLMLKVFSVVLLTVVQVVGMGGVARSQHKLPDLYPSSSGSSGKPVSPSERLDIAIQNLRQQSEAGFYRSEAIEPFGSIGPIALPKLLPLLKEQNAKMRSHAVLALGKIKDAEKLILPGIIPLLKDPEAAVRENVVRVLTDMGEAASSAVPALITALNDSDWRVRLQAASALGEMKNAALPAVPKLIVALNDPDNRVRSRAAYTLGGIGIGGSPAVPTLTLLLQDPDVYVRRSAAVALGRMGDAAKSAVPALTLLLQDPDEYVRRDATWALNPQKPAEEVSPGLIDVRLIDPKRVNDLKQQQRDREGRILGLIQTLKTGNANEKTSTIRALVEIGQPVTPYIIPLFKDPNPGIQAIAAETLDQIELEAIAPRPNAMMFGGLSARPLVRLRSAFDPPLLDISVDEAIKALREAIKTQEPRGFYDTPATDTKRGQFDSRSPYDSAVEQLQKIGQPAVPKLIALLGDDDVALRSNATEVLATMGAGSERSVPSLTALLKHLDANIRSNAARVLASWGKVTKPTLIALLQDPNPRVRSGAAEAIGRMEGQPKSAIPFLIPLLKDEKPLVRAYTVFALKGMGGFAKPAIPALTALLKDENEKVRLLTSQVLTSLKSDNPLAFDKPMPVPTTSVLPPGVPASPPTLVTPTRTVKQEIQLLRDADNYDDRRNAIVRLIRIGKPAVAELIPLLNDEYPEIRESARDALSSIGEPAIPALLPLLKHENPKFRRIVAAAIGDMGTPSKMRIQTMMRLLKDPDAKIRSLSASAIASIGVSAQSAVPELIPLLKDPDIQVRANTLGAIRSIGKPAAAAIPFIIPLLREPPPRSQSNDLSATGFYQPDIRGSAASALASMGELARPALPDLLPLLQDASSGSQNYAFNVIVNMDQSTHLSIISNLLPLLQEDGKPELQSGTARILGNLGEPAKVAIPDLTRLLNSQQGGVRSSASEALKKLGYKP